MLKPDGTPQTLADLASDDAIRASLAADLPGALIVSEEGAKDLPADFATKPFVLVDPLDGTREYIEGHPDHAVCVALIVDRRPAAAAIVAPRGASSGRPGRRPWNSTSRPIFPSSGRAARCASAPPRPAVRGW